MIWNYSRERQRASSGHPFEERGEEIGFDNIARFLEGKKQKLDPTTVSPGQLDRAREEQTRHAPEAI